MDTMGFGLCLHLKRKIIRNGVMLSKSTDSEKKKDFISKYSLPIMTLKEASF